MGDVVGDSFLMGSFTECFTYDVKANSVVGANIG